MSYPTTQTIFECETWNPLLMCRGINTVIPPAPLSYDDPDGKLKEKVHGQYNSFKTLFTEAKRQTAQKNIVFGLEADFSDTDTGGGGFYSAGFIPDVIELFHGGPRFGNETMEKEFKFFWPKDPHSDKYMRYLGSINLGLWPRILHEYTCTNKQGWYSRHSFAGGFKTFDGPGSSREFSDFWLHLWVSHQNEYDSIAPDCHVRLMQHTGLWSESHEYNEVKREEDNKKIESNRIELIKYFHQWQAEKCVESDIKAPAKFFTNLRPQFQWDGRTEPLSVKGRKTYRPEKETGIFAWDNSGDVSVYGAPHSQQEPHRPIYGKYGVARALVPFFAFTDSEADMTHQFYADAPYMDDISHKQYYCKLDSSCT